MNTCHICKKEILQGPDLAIAGSKLVDVCHDCRNSDKTQNCNVCNASIAVEACIFCGEITAAKLGDFPVCGKSSCMDSAYINYARFTKAASKSYVCHNCFYDYEICSHCNSVVSYDEARRHGNEIYCEDCFSDNFTRCESCNEYYHSDDIVPVGEYNYCPDCYSEIFTTCDNCGEIILRDDARYTRDEALCWSCYDNNRNNLHEPHSFKVNKDKLAKLDTKKRIYGIEIEAEFTKDSIDEMIDHDYHCCYDQSLDQSNGEIEVNLQPAHLPEMLKKIKKLYTEYSPYGISEGGIHIHIDRRTISALTVYKIHLILNSLHSSALYLGITNRKETRWCRPDICDASHFSKITEVNKHIAIATHHKNTYEFRCFQSTSHFSEIEIYFEFLESLIQFARNESISAIRYKYSYCFYVDFLRENKKQFSNILKKIEGLLCAS